MGLFETIYRIVLLKNIVNQEVEDLKREIISVDFQPFLQ
jgi:hypothetical protein